MFKFEEIGGSNKTVKLSNCKILGILTKKSKSKVHREFGLPKVGVWATQSGSFHSPNSILLMVLHKSFDGIAEDCT